MWMMETEEPLKENLADELSVHERMSATVRAIETWRLLLVSVARGCGSGHDLPGLPPLRSG